MVSAKKEKKGTGAERRKDQRREAALSRPYRKDRDQKKRERKERKEKKRRKAAKGEPEAPPRDYRTAARLARRCFSALFAICVFSRGNFGEAFGHGTGVNRANLAPITVAAHALMKSEFIENDHQRSVKAKMVSRALMVPGEVIGPRMPRKMRPRSRSKKFGGHLPSDPLSEKARAALDAAVADKGLGKVLLKESKEILLVGAVACIVGAIISPFYVPADSVNCIGAVVFYIGKKPALQNRKNNSKKRAKQI